MAPRTDIHFHVFGDDTDIERAKRDEALFFYPKDNQHWETWITNGVLEASLEAYEKELGLCGRLTTDVYFDIARMTLSRSRWIDNAVLLALDALFDEQGNLDPVKTDLWVPNRFLAGRIKIANDRLADGGQPTKRFLLGASVHPYRRDWSARLDEALALGARLIKLIPSVQHIDLGRVDRRYWKKLADDKLPLLLHVGPEYAFPEGRRRQDLDHVDKMDFALREGVTVIAAHCASRVFFWDPDFVDALAAKMARRNTPGATQLWADTSALCMWTRTGTTKHVLATIDPRYMLHGTDFPVSADAAAFSPIDYPKMTWGAYSQNVATKNPLDRDALIKRAIGLPDSVLEAAANVLRPV